MVQSSPKNYGVTAHANAAGPGPDLQCDLATAFLPCCPCVFTNLTRTYSLFTFLSVFPPMNSDANNQIEPVVRNFDEFES
jgi:hypothetical protein